MKCSCIHTTKILYCIVLFFLHHLLPAQENLVNNPGFEDVSGLKTNQFNQKQEAIKGFQPQRGGIPAGAPEYWKGTEKVYPSFESPDIAFSPAPAHSGTGRAGITPYYYPFFFDDMDQGVSQSFVQTSLRKPLIPGKTYYLEFYVKLEESAFYYSNTIDALFSTDSLTIPQGMIAENIKVSLANTVILSDTGWNKISGYFIADSAYRYLTIGTFNLCRRCDEQYMKKINSISYSKGYHSPFFIHQAYYYVDDLFLAEDSSYKFLNRKEHADHVVLLADISKSMYDAKYIDSLKSGLRNFILTEGKETRITLVTFGAGVQVKVCDKLLNDPSIIDSVLASFEKGSSTNIEKALATGYAIADSLYDPLANTRVILLSDALFTLSKTSSKLIKDEAKQKQISFGLYHFGTRENKKLEKVITSPGGLYSSATHEPVSAFIRKKDKTIAACTCK